MSEHHFNLTEARQQMRSAQGVFLDTLAQADERVLHHRAVEGAWSLAEVLAHVAEARQYFTSETDRLLASPGTRIGRTMQDAARLAAVQEHGKMSVADLRNALVQSQEKLMTMLDNLKETDLQVTG
jgi:uncharacterized damage-inducible protein DinB